MNANGGSALPVVAVTDSQVVGGAAISVYVVSDSRPQLGQLAKRVKVIQASDLMENGGKYWLDGRIEAMPIFKDTSGASEGNIAIPVYVVSGSL